VFGDKVIASVPSARVLQRCHLMSIRRNSHNVEEHTALEPEH
jgi:hypothetical protein